MYRGFMTVFRFYADFFFGGKPEKRNEKRGGNRLFFRFGTRSVTASCGKAFTAVNGLAFGRIEGHFASFSAVSADSIKHLSGASRSGLACIAAGFASLGLVLEALLCIEFLLTGGEHEIIAAFFALQCLVLIHLCFTSLEFVLPLDGFQPTPLCKPTLSLKLPGHI